MKANNLNNDLKKFVNNKNEDFFIPTIDVKDIDFTNYSLCFNISTKRI